MRELLESIEDRVRGILSTVEVTRWDLPSGASQLGVPVVGVDDAFDAGNPDDTDPYEPNTPYAFVEVHEEKSVTVAWADSFRDVTTRLNVMVTIFVQQGESTPPNTGERAGRTARDLSDAVRSQLTFVEAAPGGGTLEWLPGTSKEGNDGARMVRQVSIPCLWTHQETRP